MSNSQSELLKDQGNHHLKSGDYSEAERMYSEAIEISPDYAKLYSNRCTARLQLKKYEEAMKDAKKCIEKDPSWFKGYVQEGSCYMVLHDYYNAVKSYKKAMSCTNEKESIADMIKKAEKKMHDHSLSFLLFGDMDKTMYSLENIAIGIMTVLCIICMLPFLSSYGNPRRSFIICFFAYYAVNAYRRSGRIVLTKEYFKKLVHNDMFPYLVVLLPFGGTSLFPLLMTAIVCHTILPFCQFVYRVLFSIKPSIADSIYTKFSSLLNRLLFNRVSQPMTDEEKRQLLSESGIYYESMLILMMLPFSIFSAFSGKNGIMICILYLYFMNAEYSYNDTFKRLVYIIDSQIFSFVNANNRPQLLRTGYNYIRSIVYSIRSAFSSFIL